MHHVDATNATRAAPAQPADLKNVDRDDSDRSNADFASVLVSARESSIPLIEVLHGRVADLGSSSRHHQRVAKALSPVGRRDALRQRSHLSKDAQTGRVDRLKAAQNEHESTADRLKDPSNRTERIRQQRQRAQNADTRQTLPGETGSGYSERAVAEQASATAAEPQHEHGLGKTSSTASSKMTQSMRPSAGETRTSAANTSPESVNQSAQTSAFASTSAPGEAADASHRAPAAQTGRPMQPTNSPGGFTGRQAGSSGLFQDATSGSAGKTGEAAASRVNGPAVDFQNALAQAGRIRSGTYKPAWNVAQTSAKNGTPEGVNLDKADSIRQIARLVRSNIGPRHSTMVLRLDPPELGRLRVELQMHDRALTVQFQAETQAGHQALQQRLADLRGALEQHGIQLDRMDVEFRPPATPTDGPRDTHDQTQHQSENQMQHQLQEQPSSAHAQQDRHDLRNQEFSSQAETDTAGGDEAMDADREVPTSDDVMRLSEMGVNVVV